MPELDVIACACAVEKAGRGGGEGGGGKLAGVLCQIPGVPCPLCLESLSPLKLEHGRIRLHADAVRDMANMVHLDPATVPSYFGSERYHTWKDSLASSTIVMTWCKTWGPHACMCKKKFRDGTNFCSSSIEYWKGCRC